MPNDPRVHTWHIIYTVKTLGNMSQKCLVKELKSGSESPEEMRSEEDYLRLREY